MTDKLDKGLKESVVAGLAGASLAASPAKTQEFKPHEMDPEPKERYKMMPKPSSYMARDIGVWINSIDRNKLELILIESGIDFEPVVARLDYLQSFGVDHKIFWVLHFLSGDLTE